MSYLFSLYVSYFLSHVIIQIWEIQKHIFQIDTVFDVDEMLLNTFVK